VTIFGVSTVLRFNRVLHRADHFHSEGNFAAQVVFRHKLFNVPLHRFRVGKIRNPRRPLRSGQRKVVPVLLQPHVLVSVVPHPADQVSALKRVRVYAVILANLHHGETRDAAAYHDDLVSITVRRGTCGVCVGRAHSVGVICVLIKWWPRREVSGRIREGTRGSTRCSRALTRLGEELFSRAFGAGRRWARTQALTTLSARPEVARKGSQSAYYRTHGWFP
jgi:hypothetical protein